MANKIRYLTRGKCGGLSFIFTHPPEDKKNTHTIILCFVHTLSSVLHCLVLSADAVLCVSLELCPLDTAPQYYTGEDASKLRFMDSVAGQ